MKRATIAIDRISLDGGNPRHMELQSQEQIIKQLCENEKIVVLARDIVDKGGLNPLANIGVIANEEDTQKFTVVDGNRRICALKLLMDPDFAPEKYRARFKQLNEQSPDFSKMEVIIHPGREEAYQWRHNQHAGEQGGRGPSAWGAEQKIRDDPNHPKRHTQKLLDYAQRKGFISYEERKGKISVFDRYLSNRKFRDALGYKKDDKKGPTRIYPESDFDARLQAVMRDLAKGEKFEAQAKGEQIEQDANELIEQVSISGKIIPPVAISSPPPPPPSPQDITPRAPKRRTRLKPDKEVQQHLKKLDNRKLASLYFSLCQVYLKEDSVPLLTVGLWVFLETLAKNAFPKDPKGFRDIYSHERIQALLQFSKGDKGHKTVRQYIEKIDTEGNTTKHHHTAAHYSRPQLEDYMETITPLIRASIEKAIEEKESEPN